MNKNVSDAIAVLEEEVLKVLADGPHQPAQIAEKLGTKVHSKHPVTGKKSTYNPLIRGILLGLCDKDLVKQAGPNEPWELID